MGFLFVVLVVSCSTQTVLSGSITTRKEHDSVAITELQEALAKTQEVLQDTRNLLAQALMNLASSDTSGPAYEHTQRIISKTYTDDDLLSGLSLQDLLPLLSSHCKDGKDGINGINGRDGRDGKDGMHGKDGRDGLSGADGVDGSPGLKGSVGMHGLKGAPGNDGHPGAKGITGSLGPAGSKGEIGAKGSPGLRGSPGSAAQTRSVYTRWGRTSCAGGASLIYQGFAAGTDHLKTGGGVNYQCMPLRPEYNSYSNGGWSSLLSGAEYESSNLGLFSSNVDEQNVPCARCLSPKSAVMMYPAMRNCPTGWNKEYEGYLMSEYLDHAHPSTFECVDESPEYIPGYSSSTNGALFYFIKPDCSGQGTIGDCTYYSSSKQLTCVVCSK